MKNKIILAVTGAGSRGIRDNFYGAWEFYNFLEAKKEGIDCEGPIVPDSLFVKVVKGQYAISVVMYHDQGLAPFKALSFEDGVNFTAGLPVVRTSPDHGTAFEMAGRDEADPRSMRAAIFQAIDIFRNRLAWNDLQSGKMVERKIEEPETKDRSGRPQIA